jgi:hypothetical protein
MSDKPTLLFSVLDALEDALKHCAPDKRKALADALDAYSEDCAEDFWWALGQQSPTMLHMLMTAKGAPTNRPSRPYLYRGGR